MKNGDLGNKIECPACGTKYYDLGRPEPRCPKCGADESGNVADEEEE